MRFGVVVLVAALGVPGFAGAGTVTYDCTMKNLGPAKGWITERYILTHDSATDSATALDGILQAQAGGPVPAKVSGKTSAKLAFSWSLRGKDTSNKTPTMEYRAAVYKDGAITLTARPLGYSNMFEARGTCTRSG